MLKIENWRVYDLEESVIACRNSMRTEMPKYDKAEFLSSLERAKKLAPLGGGHNQFLAGIRVSFDLVYPGYISPELQRYHFFDIVCSSSKMHRLSKLDADGACNKYVTKETITQLKRLQDAYNAEPTHENFMRLISNCPLGLELFMRCSTNYLQLKNIYSQRKNHKLEDWHIFCDWIENLPFANELILS